MLTDVLPTRSTMSPSRILSVAALAAATALAPVTAYATGTPPAHTATAHSRAADHPSSQPVLVVRPGQRIDLGHGGWMTLTSSERCVGVADGYSCKSVTDGNQPPNTVSVQISGSSAGTLYSPLYIGPGQAARMTVQVAGGTYQARVVTLAGHPGYATGYVWGKADSSTAVPKITVYDASGRVLARL
jgi:hypothetical protein